MALKDQAFGGITFGEIVAIIVLLGSLLTGYTDLNIKVSNNVLKTEQLEHNRDEDRQRAEIKRTEDQKSFDKLNDKLDLILIHNDQAQYAK